MGFFWGMISFILNSVELWQFCLRFWQQLCAVRPNLVRQSNTSSDPDSQWRTLKSCSRSTQRFLLLAYLRRANATTRSQEKDRNVLLVVSGVKSQTWKTLPSASSLHWIKFCTWTFLVIWQKHCLHTSPYSAGTTYIPERCGKRSTTSTTTSPIFTNYVIQSNRPIT